jgi:type VI secretion system secreted protein VgrG
MPITPTPANASRQTTRLLRLSFPDDDGPEHALLVANRLEATEELSCDFEFKVQVLSDKPDLTLNELMGKSVTIELQRTDGSTRYFNGCVFEFGFDRNDGGFAVFNMVLRPRLAFLRLQRDNRFFHNQTVLE